MIECRGENYKPPSYLELGGTSEPVALSLPVAVAFSCPESCHFICLLFTSLPLASSDRFQPAVFAERGAVQ